MNKTLLTILIILIAIGSFVFFGIKVYAPLPSYTDDSTIETTTNTNSVTNTTSNTQTPTTITIPASQNTATTPTPSANTVTTPITSQPTTTQPIKPTTPTANTTAQADVEITYTDSGFAPTTITIKEGQTVRFLNTSNKLMWVASDPHPTHTDYPGFDQLTAVAKGKDYVFTFTKIGTWGYHNYLGRSHTGSITVTK